MSGDAVQCAYYQAVYRTIDRLDSQPLPVILYVAHYLPVSK